MLLAGLGSGSAAAAGKQKLIEGAIHDTTCLAAVCEPECPPPPHCGPITGQSTAAIVCPLRKVIACPLSLRRDVDEIHFCPPPGQPCSLPLYMAEGTVVKVRRRGSPAVIRTLPVVGGLFRTHLGPGEYVLRAFVPEPECWMAEPISLQVAAAAKSPINVSFGIFDNCVAHPGAAK